MTATKNLVNDAVSAKEGTVILEANGKRYQAATVTGFDAKITLTKVKIPQLGRKIQAQKATSAEISGTIKMHFHDPFILRLIAQFLEQGIQPQFNVTVSNADASSTSGRQSIMFEGVIPDELQLSFLDAEADEPVIRETAFTANGYRVIDYFRDRG